MQESVGGCHRPLQEMKKKGPARITQTLRGKGLNAVRSGGTSSSTSKWNAYATGGEVLLLSAWAAGTVRSRTHDRRARIMAA